MNKEQERQAFEAWIRDWNSRNPSADLSQATIWHVACRWQRENSATSPEDSRASQSAEPVALTDPDDCSAWCPRCNGSGEETVLSDNGPDAYEQTINCQHCDGHGTLYRAYTEVVRELAQVRKIQLERGAKELVQRTQPVAYVGYGGEGKDKTLLLKQDLPVGTSLYAAPPADTGAQGLTLQGLTGDQLRAAVKDARNQQGPSDAPQPTDYAQAGARAMLALLAQSAPAAPAPSDGALTDSARRLMLAADDVDMGRSIHNQRKPDDKIEGAVWDELRRASAAVHALLAAQPPAAAAPQSAAQDARDALAAPKLTVPVEELVEALRLAQSLLEELPAHTISGTRTAYAYNMVSAAINKVQRAAMSASKEGE